ncbi:MAG: hypothetical protein NTU47_14795 [Ignavibacteriales bacterium]|nr:hypothetical protein [Ignavibacteriales bacterium]
MSILRVTPIAAKQIPINSAIRNGDRDARLPSLILLWRVGSKRQLSQAVLAIERYGYVGEKTTGTGPNADDAVVGMTMELRCRD